MSTELPRKLPVCLQTLVYSEEVANEFAEKYNGLPEGDPERQKIYEQWEKTMKKVEIETEWE